jgi:hypothetical protein
MPESGVLPLIREIAAHGLTPQERPEVVSVPPAEGPALLRTISTNRLTGIAVAAVEDGWLELAPPDEAELLDKQRVAMTWAITLELRLLELAEAFEGAGIPIVVLKGSALAQCFYPDPSWRPFSDLDLLVRTSDWTRACALLHDLGFRRDLPEPRPGFDQRFGKAACHTDGQGRQIDLHRTLALGPYGLGLDLDDLFRRTAWFVVGGVRLRRLDDTASLIHACLHSSLGSWPALPMTLRDVAQVSGRGRVDWPELEDVARHWGILAVVGHALRTSSRWLGTPVPAGAERVASHRPSGSDRRLLAAYTRGRRRGGMALAVVPRIPGMRARAAYLRAMLLPDPAFLAARSSNGRRPSYLRRWTVPVRWLFSRKGADR